MGVAGIASTGFRMRLGFKLTPTTEMGDEQSQMFRYGVERRFSRADRKPYTRRGLQRRNRYKCKDTDSMCHTLSRTT